MRYLKRTAALALLLPLMAAAQPAPAKMDVDSLLNDLVHGDRHDAALDRLKAADETALDPLWDAALDEATPDSVRREISGAFNDIYKRLRAARDAAENDRSARWIQTQLIDSYNKVGSRNPAWDASALALLKSNHQDQDAWKCAKAAADAKCDDPLVRYFATQAMVSYGDIQATQATQQFRIVARDMNASHYPDALKFMAWGKFLSAALQPDCPRDISPLEKKDAFAKILALAPAFFASRPNPNSLTDGISWLLEPMNGSEFNRKEVHDQVVAAVGDSLRGDAWLDYINGYFLVQYAWEARGNGSADQMTDQGWKLFDERLKQARGILEHGWRADPLNSNFAREMITICMGQGAERTVMESWFDRATLANPDDEAACSAKLLFLAPRWGGSSQDQLGFAQQCVARGTAANRLSHIMIEAIHDLRPADPDDAETFMTMPGIWKLLEPAFLKLLSEKKDLQDNRAVYLSDRGQYLRYACQCEQWQKVVDLSKEFGDEFDLKTFGGQALYSYYLEKAKSQAAK